MDKTEKNLILSEKPILVVSLIYIYIPTMIFLVGFTAWYISLPAIVMLGIVAYRMCEYIRSDRFENKTVSVDWRFLALGCLFLLFLGYIAGWGRWVKQTYDWYKHNAVLQDLVGRSWPVYYENSGERSMLTYYLGSYMVPALIGKITSSFRTAEISLYVWNEIGLITAWLYLSVLFGKRSTKNRIFQLFMLVFFSLPQSLAEIFVWLFYGIDNMYRNSILILDETVMLQYSGHFVCLSWVFNQTIVTWLIILIFLSNKDCIRLYLFYMLPLLLFSPFPFVGLIPIAGGYAVYRTFKEKPFLKYIRQIFSFENILCLLSLGVVLVLYYYGNVFMDKPDGSSFQLIPYHREIGIYFIYVICNVCLYAALIYKKYKKQVMYYLVFGELLVFPLFSMGYYNDLMMRGSIPAIFIVMTMVTEYLMSEYPNIKISKLLNKDIILNKKILVYIWLGVLVINATLYQINRFTDRIFEENYSEISELYSYGTLEAFANREYLKLNTSERTSLINDKYDIGYEYEYDINEDLIINYFSYDIDDNLFYRYIARSHIDTDRDSVNRE